MNAAALYVTSSRLEAAQLRLVTLVDAVAISGTLLVVAQLLLHAAIPPSSTWAPFAVGVSWCAGGFLLVALALTASTMIRVSVHRATLDALETAARLQAHRPTTGPWLTLDGRPASVRRSARRSRQLAEDESRLLDSFHDAAEHVEMSGGVQ